MSLSEAQQTELSRKRAADEVCRDGRGNTEQQTKRIKMQLLKQMSDDLKERLRNSSLCRLASADAATPAKAPPAVLVGTGAPSAKASSSEPALQSETQPVAEDMKVYKVWQQAIAELQKTNTELNNELTDLKRQVGQLSDKIVSLTTRNSELRGTNLQLEQKNTATLPTPWNICGDCMLPTRCNISFWTHPLVGVRMAKEPCLFCHRRDWWYIPGEPNEYDMD